MKKKILFLFVILFVLIMSGCHEEEQIKRSIDINEDELTLTVFSENIIEINLVNINKDELVINYDKEGIVEIDNDFNVSAKSVGEVIVTFSYVNDYLISDSIKIIVEPERKIEVTTKTLTISTQEIVDIPISLTEIVKQDLGFRLDTDGIVEISEDLQIRGLSVGSVDITIFYLYDDEIYDTLTVFVEEPKEINFSEEQITLEEQSSTPLPIELINVSSLDYLDFQFSIEGIVTIVDGNIYAKKVGEVVITASLKEDNTISSSIKIIVKEKVPIYTVNDPEYWIENLSQNYNPYEVVLTLEQIKEYNKSVLSDYSATKVVDILNQNSTISGQQVKDLINNYTNISRYPVYENGISLNPSQLQIILDNRNLTQIPATVDLRYAIVTEFLAVRSYPTLDYSSNPSKDMFQETGLNVGEGVLVYHVSLDGKWYFVQAQNYNGWVEASKVGLCSYDDMKNFLNPTNFLVITADKLNVGSTIIRMGQTLPYLSKTDDYYLVKYPTRDNEGNLLLKETQVMKTEDVSDGYLEYTDANVFIQGFKMLGIPYSWGDKDINGRDCSSTQNAIYLCFGFKMPRNTSNQRKIPGYYTNVSGINDEILKSNLRPGSLIFTSSHVLMYIGEDDNGNAYVFHNTSAGVGGCRVQEFKTYTGSIIATLKLY